MRTEKRQTDQERRAEWLQRTRRHPRPTQFDYLHLRYLVRDLTDALAAVPGPTTDVLDVYCGARPYEDLLPEGSRCTGLDIADDYGLADVVSDEFLPFPDSSFDLVICVEAFYYVRDPVQGVSEIHRVLRSGGTAILTVPFVWGYDPSILERRYTGPELVELFDGWDDIKLVENGGRAVAWAFLTGYMMWEVEQAALRRSRVAGLLRPAFVACYLLINAVGELADRLERQRGRRGKVLPMDLLLSARRP